MHVIDAVLDSFSDLFRSHRYSPIEKLYSLVLFIAGLSLREMKERTERFHNNVNSKELKSIEGLVTAIAAMHNIIRAGGEEVIPTDSIRSRERKKEINISQAMLRPAWPTLDTTFSPSGLAQRGLLRG
jgi:hypothetical protein